MDVMLGMLKVQVSKVGEEIPLDALGRGVSGNHVLGGILTDFAA